MSGVGMLHILIDWWKFIQIHQYYTIALKLLTQSICATIQSSNSNYELFQYSTILLEWQVWAGPWWFPKVAKLLQITMEIGVANKTAVHKGLKCCVAVGMQHLTMGQGALQQLQAKMHHGVTSTKWKWYKLDWYCLATVNRRACAM